MWGLQILDFIWASIIPLPNSKRATLLAQKGQVQVPFLIDPNQGIELLESKDILAYLDKTYAQ
jgi:glutathione S-transferase